MVQGCCTATELKLGMTAHRLELKHADHGLQSQGLKQYNARDKGRYSGCMSTQWHTT